MTAKKGRKARYYPKLKQMIIDLGEWNTNITTISKEWASPQSTLQRWHDQIITEIGLIKPEEAGRNLVMALKSALKQCQLKMKTAKSDADISRFMRDLCYLAKTFTDIMEKYGYKEKIADKLQLDGSESNPLIARVLEARVPKTGEPKEK